jgi:hypothetical protein
MYCISEYALQRHNAENSKQIFPEKELRSPNKIHVSMSDFYIPAIDLAILLQENMWTDPGNISIAHRHMYVEIRTEAVQFPEKEYINGIFVAVWLLEGDSTIQVEGIFVRPLAGLINVHQG